MIYIDEVDVDNNICYFGCSCIGLCMAEPFVRSTTIDVSGSTKYSMYLSFALDFGQHLVC